MNTIKGYINPDNRKNMWQLGVHTCILLGIFIWMLVCNICTLWIADDFWYSFSFADGSRMESVLQIPSSMLAHAKQMNGRLTAHSLVQLFVLLPNIVFDIVNAAMCVVLVVTLSSFLGKRNALVTLAVFAALWLCLPAFGQVMLWQDGSINYLWSGCFVMLLLTQVVKICLFDKIEKTLIQKCGLIILAYVAGSYLESTSAALLFCFAAVMVVRRYYLKKKIPLYLVAAFCVSLIGYVGIYLAPAQWSNKAVGGFNIFSLVPKIDEALGLFSAYRVLWIAFIVMFCVCIKEKIEPVYLLLSGILFCGALIAHFLHLFAAGFPERGAFATGIFLIAAVVVLIGQLLERTSVRMYAVAATIVLVVSVLRPMAYGLYDIGKNYLEMRDNEAIIVQNCAQGIKDITLTIPGDHSKYCVTYGLQYLDTSSPDGWPNGIMAEYFGVDSIAGIQ